MRSDAKLSEAICHVCEGATATFLPSCSSWNPPIGTVCTRCECNGDANRLAGGYCVRCRGIWDSSEYVILRYSSVRLCIGCLADLADEQFGGLYLELKRE